MAIPTAGQRVLALLALTDSGASRQFVAGALWPEKPQVRAAANLRTALWRLPDQVRQALDSSGARLGLDRRWSIDLAEARTAAAVMRRIAGYDPSSLEHFQSDLLDGWDEPWLTIERERFHQLRIHALELLADRQLDAGDAALAAETALAAISAEPLRESATTLLIRAEIALDNRAAAVEHYRRLSGLLRTTCGVDPSGRLRALITPLVDDTTHLERQR